MNTLVRFLCFFGLWFSAIFVTAAGSVFLGAWIEAASRIPPDSGITLLSIAETGLWIVPFTLYLTLVFSINYGRRRNLAPPLVLIFAALLAGLFTFGASRGLNIAANMEAPPLELKRGLAGQSGLILSRPGTVITLLDRPSNADGSRVVSIDDRPLIYQKEPRGADGRIIGLPPMPFRHVGAWLYDDILSDFSISGQRMAARFEAGNASFFSWTLALSVLLVSLGFVFEMTSWPLANFFFGLLVFRGVLAFEVFLTSEEIMEYINWFIRGVIPDMFIAPAILAAAAVLILIYSVLFYLARSKAPAKTVSAHLDTRHSAGGGGVNDNEFDKAG
jgi:hypothetical protein